MELFVTCIIHDYRYYNIIALISFSLLTSALMA